VPVPIPPSPQVNFYGNRDTHERFRSRRWRADLLGHEPGVSRAFFDHKHLMTVLLDGGGLHPNLPKRQNNASLVLTPIDPTSGKPVSSRIPRSGRGCLHVTFEVDAHFGGRRWCELQMFQAGDDLFFPGKFAEAGARPCTSGNLIRWQIQRYFHTLDLFRGIGDTGLEQFGQIDIVHARTGDRYNNGTGIGNWPGTWVSKVTRSEHYHPEPNLNGSIKDLDLRHRFDLYIDSARFRLCENNIVLVDRALSRPLPTDEVSFALVHQRYHSEHERIENEHPYWLDLAIADERHWDNVAAEILPEFPLFAQPA